MVLVPRATRGVFVFALVALASLAGRATASPAAGPALKARGTVEGSLNTSSTLQVRLTVSQTQGWQHISSIDVDLELRHRPLDLLRFTPSASILEIVGFGPPARLGQTGLLLGAYFKIDPSKVTLTARGTTLSISAPVRLLADPPAGARLTLDARDDLGGSTGTQTLTPPVKPHSGFSWGTLGLAIALALFAGGFVGNIVSTRRRPPPRPSIYGAVQRRLEQDKART